MSPPSPATYSVSKFPEPPGPGALRAIARDEWILPTTSEVWRVYFSGGPYPTTWNTFRFFGPLSTARFDHHRPPPSIQDRGVLYAAEAGSTCIAEVFQAQRLIDRARRQPWLVGFAVNRPIRLLNLRGVWPTRAGASMALNSGPRPRAQRWSAAIYDAYPDVDGLWYPSSMFANEPAILLYERSADAIAPSPFFQAPLTHPGLAVPLYHLARQLRYSLV